MHFVHGKVAAGAVRALHVLTPSQTSSPRVFRHRSSRVSLQSEYLTLRLQASVRLIV
jgi:hypothetical protein